jgi:multidrug efflux pump subunit AcrB
VLSIGLLGKNHTVSEGLLFGVIKKTYGGIVWAAVKARWVVVPAALAGVVLATLSFYPFLGTEIFPKVDNGQIQLRIRAVPGTKLDKTEALSLKTLEIIQEVLGRDQVSLTMGLIGVHAPNYPINLIYQFNGGTDEAVVQIQMKPGTGVDLEAAKEKMRARLKQELPDTRFSFEPADIVSRVMSFGAPTPIEIAVSGPSLPDIKGFADKIKAELEKIKGLRDLQFAQTLDYPTLDVNINRERAGLQGVKMAEAAKSVATATSSTRFILPGYWADGKTGVSYSVQVQVPQMATKSVEDLRNIPVAQKDGQPVLLRNIGTIKEGTAVAQYERYNMQRLVSLTANYAGTDLGSIGVAVNKAIKAAGDAPAKVKVDVRGQIQPMTQMLDNLMNGLVLAVVVIFLLLAANFQSVRLALVVVSTVPAVICGVTLVLFFTGTTLNIQSYIGSIMGVGVAVANSILLVTFAERNRLTGMNAVEASIEAAKTRLRPILMTSLAMIAGMMPMAIGLGDSGAQTAPLGRAVVGGLLFGTTATLLVVPSVFALMMVGRAKKSSSLDPDDPDSSLYDLGNTHENAV